MKENNIEFFYPNDVFYFSHREVYGHFNMLTNHFHNTYEIYYLLTGERHYFIKDRVFHVKAGNLVLINENDLHKTTDAKTNDHTRILINFKKKFLPFSPVMDNLIDDLFNKNNNVISLLPTDQQHIESLLYKMTHEVQNQEAAFEVSLQSLLLELLVYTKRIKGNTAEALGHLSPTHEKIHEIIQYINENYHSPITLPTLSQKYFISQYHLSRAFKQVTGFTFIEYLNSVRIREAQLLLRNTNDRVTDIVDRVGFQNNSHFGRVFKEITKLSPLQFRKLNR